MFAHSDFELHYTLIILNTKDFEVIIPRRILRGKHCLTVAWVAADRRQVYSRHASPAPHCSAPAPSAPHSSELNRSPHRAQRSGSAEAAAAVLLSRDVRDAVVVVVVVVVFTLAVVCMRVMLCGCGDPGSGRGSPGPR